MKLFTDFEQTQILKSLGYSHPISERGYNIGELMSFLPPVQIEPLGDYDRITVDGEPPKQYIETQVIDALYKACVGQKEDVKPDDLGEKIAQLAKEKGTSYSYMRLALQFANFMTDVKRLRDLQREVENMTSIATSNGMGFNYTMEQQKILLETAVDKKLIEFGIE